MFNLIKEFLYGPEVVAPILISTPKWKYVLVAYDLQTDEWLYEFEINAGQYSFNFDGDCLSFASNESAKLLIERHYES